MLLGKRPIPTQRTTMSLLSHPLLPLLLSLLTIVFAIPLPQSDSLTPTTDTTAPHNTAPYGSPDCLTPRMFLRPLSLELCKPTFQLLENDIRTDPGPQIWTETTSRVWQGVGTVCSIRVVYYANAGREPEIGDEEAIVAAATMEPFTFKDVKKTAMTIFKTCYFGGSVTYRNGLTFSLDAYQFITDDPIDQSYALNPSLS